MNKIINVYGDESCHLKNDKVMALGALWCYEKNAADHISELKRIKRKHKYRKEIKWNTVRTIFISLYLEWLDYFFDSKDLNFRGLIIPDLEKLDHISYKQTHDEWSNKMYYELLEKIIFFKKDDFNFKYHIYLDRRETKDKKEKELHNWLKRKFSNKIIEKVQPIHSHENELVQLTDLLVGAICYANRGLSSKGKEEIITHIQERSNLTLLKTTSPKREKVNLLCWIPSKQRQGKEESTQPGLQNN